MKHPKFFALAVVLFFLTALMPIANSISTQTYPDHWTAISFTFCIIGTGTFFGCCGALMYAFGGME